MASFIDSSQKQEFNKIPNIQLSKKRTFIRKNRSKLNRIQTKILILIEYYFKQIKILDKSFRLNFKQINSK